MLTQDNTPSAPVITTPTPIPAVIDSNLPWRAWLDAAASAFDRAAAKEPVSERLAWVGALLRECSDQAHLHNIQSPGEHTDFLNELRDTERALTRDNGSAAQTPPRDLAGHPDQWDELRVDDVEGDLPW